MKALPNFLGGLSGCRVVMKECIQTRRLGSFRSGSERPQRPPCLERALACLLWRDRSRGWPGGARNGDRAAFAELYDTHVDSVYRYLLYRVREPSDAEDLTSEVFTRAFANIHRYRWQGKSFLAWLYTIARNAVTDRRRRESRR